MDAFDFCNDHAHAFFFGRTWADDHTAIYTDFIDDAERFSSKVKLHEMLEVGINFIYIFDFGDEWTFRCKVLKTLKSPLKEYQIIKSVGIAPPQYGEEDEEEDEEYEE